MSMDERPDLDTLADYLEDLLDADARLAVARWIERDPPTAELVRELSNLPALLAAEPVGAMPSDVAERLDAALAAEAKRADEQAAPVTGLPVQRRRRWLAPALVAAAAVGVFGIGAQVLDTGGLDAAGGDASMAETAPRAAAGDADAAPNQDMEAGPAEEDAGEQAPEANAGRVQDRLDGTELASVSAKTFQRDVLRVVQNRRLGANGRGDVPSEALALSSTYSIVAEDCAADLGSGRYAAIRLDGEPALLVLRRVPGQPRQREAAAYPARCPPAALVDSDDMTLPALVRATITLP